MGKKVDMTSWIMKEHGVPESKWTVLYELPERKNGNVIWHCKCECGNECNVAGVFLRSGESKSCGCLKSKKTRERTIKILPKGTRFGKLTVLKLLDERVNTKTCYQCQCDCGKIVNVIRGDLVDGKVSSCGCLKFSLGELKIKEILKNNNIFYETQKFFKDCKDQRMLPFDFYVDNKYIIEFDGEQHFRTKNSGWDTEEHLIRTQEHDNIKNQYCFEHNIPIIRIPYTHLKDLCLEDLILKTSKFLLKQEE